MNPTNQANPQVEALLEQLQPIVAPPAPGFWPPAPGWWVLLVASLMALTALVLWLTRRRARGAYRRQALAELAKLEPQPTPAYAMQVESLLKRAALHAYPTHRATIARLHGRPWVEFLSQSGASTALGETERALTEGLYRPSAVFDPALVHQEVQAWLKRHGPVPSGVTVDV